MKNLHFLKSLSALKIYFSNSPQFRKNQNSRPKNKMYFSQSSKAKGDRLFGTLRLDPHRDPFAFEQIKSLNNRVFLGVTK